MNNPLVTSTEKNAQGVGGLCHLVEAATALSKLVDVPRQTKDQIERQQLSKPSSTEAAVTLEKSIISDDDDDSCKKNEARSKREIFPQRLMAILNDTSLTEIVTWLPNGRSFVIVRPDVFTDTVLPKYLPPVDARGSTKYPSFTRKLNRWGFRQVTRGPDTGAFHHPLFRRDEPLLCLQMVCQRSRDRRSSNKGGGMSALPPKKRNVGGLNDSSVNFLQTPQQHRPILAPTLTTACVSSDDNSSSSESRSSSSSNFTSSRERRVELLNVAIPPSTVGANRAVAHKPPVAGFLSKDETLVKGALKQSMENERLRAAKAMLYHAYMQALGSTGR